MGLQTNGGKLDERWTFSGFYELRSPNAFSVVIDYHVWRYRLVKWNGVENIENFSTQAILNLGFKFRLNVKKISVGLQAGVGSGIVLAPVSFFYSGTLEYMLSRKFAITLSQKKYAFPEINHFFFLGVITRLP
ncbi:MAG: hypothetical protein ABSF91_08760 [Bacteroidota bacterium]